MDEKSCCKTEKEYISIAYTRGLRTIKVNEVRSGNFEVFHGCGDIGHLVATFYTLKEAMDYAGLMMLRV